MIDEREVTIRLSHPAVASATGAGVVVAVVDSGVAPGHPHVGAIAGGCWITPDDELPDWGDRIGHGTAVAGAIREKAPAAELLAVRIFATRLATSASLLVRAIEWGARHGARLINLSLGTSNPAHEALLADAVRRAREHGAMVVAAAPDGDRRWLPGALPGVIAVLADPVIPRDEARIVRTPLGVGIRCSPYPRPIAGVPVDRNLSGTSFAVANATGVLARVASVVPSHGGTEPFFEALYERFGPRTPDETATKG